MLTALGLLAGACLCASGSAGAAGTGPGWQGPGWQGPGWQGLGDWRIDFDRGVYRVDVGDTGDATIWWSNDSGRKQVVGKMPDSLMAVVGTHWVQLLNSESGAIVPSWINPARLHVAACREVAPVSHPSGAAQLILRDGEKGPLATLDSAHNVCPGFEE